MSRPPLFVHYHVPKTGGQTIRTTLATRMEPGSTFLHLGPWARQQGYTPYSNEGIAELSAEARDRVRAVVGHNVDPQTIALFEGRELWEFTMLRDPAVRMVSHFNFHSFMRQRRAQEPIGFDEWYGAQEANIMTTFLSRRVGIRPGDVPAMIARLHDFRFVGDTRHMDTWLADLFKVMGVPGDTPPRVNVTGVDHQRVLQLSDTLRERIEADHPLDVKLYGLASAELFPPSIRSLRALAATLPEDDPEHEQPR